MRAASSVSVTVHRPRPALEANQWHNLGSKASSYSPRAVSPSCSDQPLVALWRILLFRGTSFLTCESLSSIIGHRDSLTLDPLLSHVSRDS